MMDSNLITVDEFGKFFPEVNTANYDAPTISGMISQASKMATDYLEYTPYAEDIVDELAQGMITTEGDLLVLPRKVPIQSVSAMSITKGTVTINLGLIAGGVNRYNIDYSQRNIRYPYQEISIQGQVIFTNFYQLRNSHFYTKVSYRGGWEPDELPASIKRAVGLMVKDILTGQYNAQGATSLRQGAVAFGFAAGQDGESKLMKDAKRALGPYRRIR